MANSNFTSGNISTIIKWVSMTFAGWMVGVLASYGFNLNIDVSVLAEVIGAFIFMILGYWDSRDHNTFGFLGNGATPEVGSTESETEIEDIDPAIEYEDDDCA